MCSMKVCAGDMCIYSSCPTTALGRTGSSPCWALVSLGQVPLVHRKLFRAQGGQMCSHIVRGLQRWVPFLSDSWVVLPVALEGSCLLQFSAHLCLQGAFTATLSHEHCLSAQQQGWGRAGATQLRTHTSPGRQSSTKDAACPPRGWRESL